MLITTTDTLQGVEIKEYIGLVAVRVASAKAATFKGYEKSTEATITSIEESLSKAAEKMNADAVIGLKITPESMSTFAVGTAVKLK